jgi:hypothetical protein
VVVIPHWCHGAEHDPADSLACSGLRAQLGLEQRLLRSQDGKGLWRGPDSAQIISVIGWNIGAISDKFSSMLAK